jgi:hypothetical protein
MEAMSLQGLKLTDTTARPDKGGTKGRAIQVKTNCFQVTQYGNGVKAVRYHYDTTIVPVEENTPGQ